MRNTASGFSLPMRDTKERRGPDRLAFVSARSVNRMSPYTINRGDDSKSSSITANDGGDTGRPIFADDDLIPVEQQVMHIAMSDIETRRMIPITWDTHVREGGSLLAGRVDILDRRYGRVDGAQ